MIKKYKITNEEFEAIKEAIDSVLSLYQYDFISADSGEGSEISMSIKTFFEVLKGEFIIID
jgi:thiamine monophosphate kinase